MPEQVCPVGSIGHQRSRIDVFAASVNCRQSLILGQGVDSLAVAENERVGCDVKRIRAALEWPDSGYDFICLPDFDWRDFDAERSSRRLNLAHLQHGAGSAGIG